MFSQISKIDLSIYSHPTQGLVILLTMTMILIMSVTMTIIVKQNDQAHLLT